MERRKFILLTAVGGTATAFAGLQCSNHQPAVYSFLGKPGALSQICDVQTIREIGLAYQMQKPEENGDRKLADLLLTDSAGQRVPSSADIQFIQSLIDKKIVQDFEKGNTVVVKRWILAITEARQCALFATLNR